MSEQVLAAVIAGMVALVTAFVTAFVTGYSVYLQIKKERDKFIADLKVSYNLELYKARLKTYPKLLEIIGALSVRSAEPLTARKVSSIALEINKWLYSAGGLCAEEETRGAVLGLRELCLQWNEDPPPKELYSQLYKFRDAAVILLRRDLDLEGLESYDFENISSLFDKIQSSIDKIQQKPSNKLLRRQGRKIGDDTRFF